MLGSVKLRILVLIFFGIICFCVNAQYTHMNINGSQRSYLLHLPASYDPSVDYPLLMALHGNGSNGVQMSMLTGFNDLANNEEFIVVYPNAGLPSSIFDVDAWNYELPSSVSENADFFLALTDEIANNYSIDMDRVYLTGFSGGGYMTYEVLCDLQNKFAAFAVNAGLLSNTFQCSVSKTIPILHIHGTEDLRVTYDASAIDETERMGVEDGMQFWANFNGCSINPVIEDIPNINLQDNCSVEKWSYTPFDMSCSQVILYKILSGGHHWPDSPIDIEALTGIDYGHWNKDINCSQVIWDFFYQHTLTCDSINNDLSSMESNASRVSLYPNPFSNFFVVEVDSVQSFVEIKVFDLDGRILKTKQYLSLKKCTLDISDLSDGIYQLQIITNNFDEIMKIVKQ